MNSIESLDYTKLTEEIKYKTARSGGSGGQHVNKVETKVTAKLNIKKSLVLTGGQKEILFDKLKNQISKKDNLVLHHETDRSQIKNKAKVTKKLISLIKKALKQPKKRKKTRPSKSAMAERKKNKKVRSDVKATRKKPRVSEW